MVIKPFTFNEPLDIYTRKVTTVNAAVSLRYNFK